MATENSGPWGTFPDTPSEGIEFRCGFVGDSWRWEQPDGMLYRLSLSHPTGWMLTATDEALRWSPVPTIRVEVRRPGEFDYNTTGERLEIPGATKRHVPMDAAHKAVLQFRDGIIKTVVTQKD